MTQPDLFDAKFRGIAPDDTRDPARFGQPTETVADLAVLSLREFFGVDQPAGRLRENPTIEKYTVDDTTDPFDAFETQVRIVQEFPDRLERLPHISVVTQGGRNRRMSIGRTVVAAVQDAPFVETTKTVDDDFILPSPAGVLRYRTQPHRPGEFVESEVRFPNGTCPTLEQVAATINRQTLYATASIVAGRLRIRTGGVLGGRRTPNVIEILPTSTPELLTALGLSVGSVSSGRQAANRYHQATEVTLGIDIFASDPNVRREVVDQVYSWATFWLERNLFELNGRSWTDPSVSNEWDQVILHQEVSLGGQSGIARPNDAKDKVHTQRVTVPTTCVQYIDRTADSLNSEDVVRDDTLIGRT